MVGLEQLSPKFQYYISIFFCGSISTVSDKTRQTTGRDGKMEKGIEVIARYHYKKDYFVEVTHEKSALAGRDYWLCKRGSSKKMFMFSSLFKNEKAEEHLIVKHIQDNIRKYEKSVPETLYA